MGKKKPGHPCWFKLFDSNLGLLETAPPEAVKDGLCAALRYLAAKELPSLNSEAQMLFMVLKRDLDLAWDTYQKKIRRWEARQQDSVAEGIGVRYHAIAMYRRQSNRVGWYREA